MCYRRDELMTKLHSEHEDSQFGEATEQKDRRQHDTPSWAKRYLDLADQAMTGNSSDNSNQS